MKESTRQTLARCDLPDSYEFPPRFDYAGFESRAQSVDRRLREHLGERTTFEGAVHNQDASFGIAICLHTHEQCRSGGLFLPCLRFSNFGDLVSMTFSDLVPEDRHSEIEAAVREKGFTFIPEEELDEPYDGVMSGKFRTWWIRYFDWL